MTRAWRCAVQGELFHMDPLEPTGPMSPGRKKWGGRASQAARAYCKTLLPRACWRGCGKIITSETPARQWQAGHVEGRGEGGQDDVSNYMPECTECNLREGGRLGAAITNGRGVRVEIARERTIKWY